MRPLAEALKAQGWSAFWDRTIPPGKTWHEVIDAALHKVRCVIVAWSEASIQSSWVREEAEEGRGRKILVPVLFAEVKPPIDFRSIQAASLVNWDGRPTAEEFQQLVSAVADILGSPKQPAEPRLPPQEPEPAGTDSATSVTSAPGEPEREGQKRTKADPMDCGTHTWGRDRRVGGRKPNFRNSPSQTINFSRLTVPSQ